MQDYQKEFARALAESGALFFADGLRLKDGRPTPYFINMGVFRTGRLSSLVGSLMARLMVDRGMAERIDVVVGPSYKGSSLAVAVVQALYKEFGIDVAYEYDRKEAKAHGEATGRPNLFVTGALTKGARLFIVDDVGTSMATKYDLLDLLKSESEARGLDLALAGVGLCVDREQTSAVYDKDGNVRLGVKGEDAIGRFVEQTGLPVWTLAGVRDVVDYLASSGTPVLVNGERRPLDNETLARFNDYLKEYGVDGRRG